MSNGWMHRGKEMAKGSEKWLTMGLRWGAGTQFWEQYFQKHTVEEKKEEKKLERENRSHTNKLLASVILRGFFFFVHHFVFTRGLMNSRRS